MPELPEITVIAKQMNNEIAGRQVAEIEVRQPKNLNMPVAEFTKAIVGKTVNEIYSRGKWAFIKLESEYNLLLNLGMGGDLIFFVPSQSLPEKYQFKLTFADGSGFTMRFFWFGYIHLVQEENLSKHKMTSSLGISPTEDCFTLKYFEGLLNGRKSQIKSFLLDQKHVAGIGNVYIQDILFSAGLHPNRRISTLTREEKTGLYNSIHNVLESSIKLRGLAYEKDFYGKNGGFTMNEFIVGYKTGQPCPKCGTKIEKIRTGSTSSYICPKCQQMK
jgi:formamidopyrimidine-DNA glycosylase